MSQKVPSTKCKHGILCYYFNGVLHGCEKCKLKGKLLHLALADASATLPGRANNNYMEEVNTNPFQKSSRLVRSPTSLAHGTPVKNNDSVSEMETQETTPGGVITSAGHEKETLVKSILQTNEDDILQNTSLTANAKQLLVQSVTAVKALFADNVNAQKLIKEQNERFELILKEKSEEFEQLQAQINALKPKDNVRDTLINPSTKKT